jgi:hypothetical protein
MAIAAPKGNDIVLLSANIVLKTGQNGICSWIIQKGIIKDM